MILLLTALGCWPQQGEQICVKNKAAEPFCYTQQPVGQTVAVDTYVEVSRTPSPVENSTQPVVYPAVFRPK